VRWVFIFANDSIMTWDISSLFAWCMCIALTWSMVLQNYDHS